MTELMMISEIQDAIAKQNLDGWLFFDHHRRDPLAYRILGLEDELRPSRRWYYFVPKNGSPRKLVHRIEAGVIDSVPGQKELYSTWVEQQRMVHDLLAGAKKIAMQYSPNCSIPYVSTVDGGTLELVRSCGVEVRSSADLIQEFEARWSREQLDGHLAAGRKVDHVRQEAFQFVASKLRAEMIVNEFEVQQFIRDRFDAEGLVTDHGPIVAVNENASDPHYEPTVQRHRQINKGDVLLIDLWAKLKFPEAVYYDVTWTGFCGNNPPTSVEKIFEIVKGARKAACELVIQRAISHNALFGWEVDDAARHYIAKNHLEEFFFHRTGHSIGVEVHGNGANMDNFESHDDRQIIPNTCFSIEPGIYLPEFGIRSEVNVYVEQTKAWVTGEEQEALVKVLD